MLLSKAASKHLVLWWLILDILPFCTSACFYFKSILETQVLDSPLLDQMHNLSAMALMIWE
jgi:hypothetical protein